MKKDKKRLAMIRRYWQIYVFLTGIIFIVILISSGLLLLFQLILYHYGMGDLPALTPSILLKIILLYLISLLIGASISIMVMGRFLRPVLELTKAIDKICDGNFDVYVSEHFKVRELRLLAIKFNRMVRELHSAEMMGENIMADISHEYKTPLSILNGYLSLALDEGLSLEEKEEYIKASVGTVERMTAVTENMLTLSRLQSKSINTRCSIFSLDEQIRMAVLLYEPKWTEKELIIEPDLEKVSFYGNEGLLSHVWTNLLDNAIKFSRPGGMIRIRLRAEEDKVTVTVADDGEGMTPQTAEHIFEKFFQGDSSRHTPGVGLGLVIVRSVVDLHDGTISVQTEPGKGASFTIELPLKK